MKLLLLLFGLTFIGAACNTPAWVRLAYASVREPFPWRIRAVRLGIALVNLGTVIGCWVRGSQAQFLHGTVPAPVPLVVWFSGGFKPVFWTMRPGFIPAYLSLILAGEALMLVASADALRESKQPRFCLFAFLMLAPLWAAYVGMMAR